MLYKIAIYLSPSKQLFTAVEISIGTSTDNYNSRGITIAFAACLPEMHSIKFQLQSITDPSFIDQKKDECGFVNEND